MKTPIPLPKDPRHQRFADNLLAGMGTGEAYIAAGFRVKKQVANPAAARLKKSRPVKDYMDAIRQASAVSTVLSVIEKREFFARIVRTPITKLSPDEDKNADLIKSFARNESEMGSSLRLEKLDPLKAIELDNKLSGDDPEANSLRDLADAIGRLAPASGLPTGKM
jgi:hypothetical protein